MSVAELQEDETQLHWVHARLEDAGVALSGNLLLTDRRLVFDPGFWELLSRDSGFEMYLSDIDYVERHGYFSWIKLDVFLSDGRVHVFRQAEGLGLGRFTRKLIEQLELSA